ncbi:uncharacterized protein ColSpa_05730 [Colletotrichum spaethianum]|uniref:Uncharacterized protein n=1 Tax=Colletotrichum spaethianum TaxID=700344 RepID=A0AA37LDT1_9PEZI|nr:uncharacterized protein ColSpa_05730 [Colletotrichum spaethianum]GKT45549.1 hypothetical protein ColSpa_05730 [Colletotrichum spaethianum]
MPSSTEKSNDRTGLPDTEADVTKTALWAMPKDPSLLSVVDQIIINNLEGICKQNSFIMKLLLQLDEHNVLPAKTTKSKKRAIQQEAGEESDAQDADEHVACFRAKYESVLFDAYKSFIESTGKTPYVKRGSTNNLLHDASDFQTFLINQDCSKFFTKWSVDRE